MTTHDTGMPTTGIHLNRVSKAYGGTEVLTDVTAYLPPDRIYGLLGANGVGKTTLMSVVCNHTFRTGGTVLIDGADPAENADVLARTCFIREDQPYNDSFKVRDVLGTVPWFYPNWDTALAERLVDRFRLPLGTTCKKLSRGQRSALAIVISLAARAPYTFLDEPYLGLDASARTIFYDELLLAYAEHPRTIIMSTHLIDEAAGLMEEVLVLDGGRIVLRADADEARASAFVARGLDTAVTALVGDREVLSERRLGRILSVTVRGTLTGADEERARAENISIEGASLQELVAALGSGASTGRSLTDHSPADHSPTDQSPTEHSWTERSSR
jgi:ABC-2 type transport system ATP-binding protein